MGPLPNLDGLAFFAVVGFVSAALALFVGLPLAVWWLWSHLSWVA